MPNYCFFYLPSSVYEPVRRLKRVFDKVFWSVPRECKGQRARSNHLNRRFVKSIYDPDNGGHYAQLL